MTFFKKIIGALIAGLVFFVAQVIILIVLPYILAKFKGLVYDFHVTLHEAVRFGLYLGGVIAVLAFIGTPRRGPPF
jgi:chromate transport protein ChrA